MLIWWRADRGSLKVEQREIVIATSTQVVFDGGKRENKSTPRHWWRPTRDAAVDAMIEEIEKEFRHAQDALALAAENLMRAKKLAGKDKA